MAGVTWDLSESLSASLEQTTRYVAEQKAFQEAVGKMQSDLLQHMDDSKTQLDVSFGSITKSAEASMQYLISRLFTGVSEASKQMEDLSAVSLVHPGVPLNTKLIRPILTRRILRVRHRRFAQLEMRFQTYSKTSCETPQN